MLLATPDAVLASAASAALAKAGWTVMVAGGAEAAVSATCALAPDVLVLDDRLERIAGRRADAWLELLSVAQPAITLSVGSPIDEQSTLRRPLTVTAVVSAIESAAIPEPAPPAGFALDTTDLRVHGPYGSQMLTATEYRLARLLLTDRGEGRSSVALKAAVGGSSSVRVHLGNLRRKLLRVTGNARYVVHRKGAYHLHD
ncbi:MAG: hypothetical protein EXR52_02620 [Dehalococcoidia bacterium]|nr:hypothetical protein [Dehalococcoidia bacterium]